MIEFETLCRFFKVTVEIVRFDGNIIKTYKLGKCKTM